jgi:hypothetical protein
VIGWSAVVNSGAQVLGPFRDSDVMVYHDNPLPPATWLPEIGTVTEADPSFTGTVMSPKRICAQVAISRQLLVQSTGNQALDEFIGSRIMLMISLGSRNDISGVASKDSRKRIVIFACFAQECSCSRRISEFGGWLWVRTPT